MILQRGDKVLITTAKGNKITASERGSQATYKSIDREIGMKPNKPVQSVMPTIPIAPVNQNVGKKWQKFNVRAANVKTEVQQAKIAADQFAQTKKPQSLSEGTSWMVDDKYFFTKQAAENFAILPTTTDFQGDQGKYVKVDSTSKQAIAPFNDAKEDSKWAAVWTVEGTTKEFKTEKEANQFIAAEEAKKPFFNKAPSILPLQAIWSQVDKASRANYEESIAKPKDIQASIMSTGSTFQAGLLNMVVAGGDLIDKHLLGIKVKEKKQVFTSPNVYDKLFEGATKDMKLQGTYPYLINPTPVTPFEKGNIFEKAYVESKSQWDKQTIQQNIGQSLAAVPMIAIDVLAVKGGIGLGKAAIKPIAKMTVRKITPTLVDSSIQGSKSGLYGSKITIVKSPMVIKPRAQGVMSTEQAMKMVTPKQVKIVKGDPTKVPTNKLDPKYKPVTRANELDLGTGISPKETIVGKINISAGAYKPKSIIEINLEKAQAAFKKPKPVKLDSSYKPATRSNEIDGVVMSNTDVMKMVQPKGGIGFPQKLKTKTTKRIQEDPYYKPAKRANEIDYTDGGDFDNLSGSRSFFKNIDAQEIRLRKSEIRPKKITKSPDYNLATEQFKSFQKGLEPTDIPRWGSTTVKLGSGAIKNQKGFNPKSFDNLKKKRKPDTDIFKDDTSKTGDDTMQTMKGGQVLLMKPQKKMVKLTSRTMTVRTTPFGQKLKPRKSQEARIISTRSGQQTVSPMKKVIVKTEVKSKLELKQKPKLAERVKAKAKQGYKLSPALVTMSSTSLAFAQPQKQKPKVAQRLKQATPTPQKPRLRQTSKPKFRVRVRPKLRQTIKPAPKPQRKRVIAFIPPYDETRKKKKRSSKDANTFGFLGNTRLDNIEGLFRRSDIIYGDKRIRKQIKQDKKAGFIKKGVSIF